MNFAFVLDPLDTLTVYKDSSFAMMVEAASRSHTLYVMQQQDVVLQLGRVLGHARKLTLTGNEDDWYRAGEIEVMPLERFDAVLMRKDPPYDMEYIYSTYLLELAETQGARVFNKPRALRDFNEKLAIAKFNAFTAPSLVTRRAELILKFLAQHHDVILKPLDGMAGRSVFRIREQDVNLNATIETLTQHGTRTIMSQRYIPEVVNGDKRILLIDGIPAPYALARIPKPGETRANLAAGGTGVAQPLSPRDQEIAEALGPQLAKEGLILVGLDVIGDYLTEINVTSPTCMREITDQTGFNVAGMMLDALEKTVKRKT
ncbi:MAG TPA: glutathione synthase [Burkholderiales bacterium]|nr:glutathione synthase [Burkholderiales bacterium]